MRILLATAVAIAPLMTATGALAEVVISNARTTAIQTSNATGTAADAIRIASGGSIALASGTAVTIDSSHNFTLDSGGAITMANSADGATGVRVLPGNTSNLSINGPITVTDTLADGVDSDGDGDIDGPWATGSGRYGIRIMPGGTVTGDLIIGGSGSVAVEGNNSYAVSIESALTGKVQNFGAIRAAGDNVVGLRTTAPISGAVTVMGSVSTRGANASAASFGDNIGGRLTLQGEFVNSGYRYLQRYPDSFESKLEDEDKLQAGAAVIVAGDVGGGVVIDLPPADKDSANTDEDGDGIVDTSEGRGIITNYAGAPALVIGSTSRAVTLSQAGAGDLGYGLINRGTITGQGLYDGVTAAGVVIGGQGGGATSVLGGVRNEGTITAVASEANATALRLGAGASVPTLYNSGTIAGSVIGDVAAESRGVVIEAGATLSSINNRGSIGAAVGDGVASATAIRDQSGTLTSITNNRLIQAVVSSTAGGVSTGTATSIDVRQNTTGVSIIQDGIASTGTFVDSDGDGVSDLEEPAIVGDIYLGSGADVVDMRNGLLIGDISFGAGADQLSVSGGALVRGALSDSDGALSINVSKGTLETLNTTALNATSLNVGADGNLVITINPASSSAGTINVSGTATLADGAGLGVRIGSKLDSAQRFTLIDATTLNAGALDQSAIQANSPYLYVVQAGVDQPNNIIYADVRRRTADEAGLIPVEAQMYDAFYGSLTNGEAVTDAFLSQRSREEFINLYEQLLPEHSGGPLLSLSSGVDAVTRALVGRNASAAPGQTSAWVQEINFYADKDKTDTYGFRSEGFGFAGGIERGGPLGAVGVSAAFTSSDLEDPESEAEEVLSANLLEVGLYWRAQGAKWTTWARAAGGYASFESERRLVGSGLNLSNTSSWNGYSAMVAGGASFEESIGRLTIRPEAYLEYFYLSEGGHAEEGGGDGFDLDIDDRQGHLFAATAAVNLGWSNPDSWVKPELRIGWRQNISVDPGETIARFRSGGPDFTLTPGTIEGGGPILGFRVNVGNALGMLSVSADAEMIEDYVRYMLFLRASFRF